MRRVLITGGAGFIGSVLGRSLVARGDQVRVLDNLSTGQRGAVPKRAEFIEGDVCDTGLLRRAVKDCNTIVHLAANCSVEFSIDAAAESTRINVQGTVSVLEAAAQARTKPRVVFASSCSVYGDIGTQAADEDRVPKPRSNYAVSKRAGELYCTSYNSCHTIDTAVVRLFNVYGAGQRAVGPYAAAVPAFCRAALRKKPLVLFGGGSQCRDFIHVDDAVRALALVIGRAEPFAGDIINIGTGTATSIRTLARTIGAIIGRRLTMEDLPPRKGEVAHSQAAISKAEGVLGFRPEVGLMEGLSITLPSYL